MKIKKIHKISKNFKKLKTMNAGNKKTRKLNDTEKFVCAVEKDDNVKAMKHLEDILRKKAHKKIQSVLNN